MPGLSPVAGWLEADAGRGACAPGAWCRWNMKKLRNAVPAAGLLAVLMVGCHRKADAPAAVALAPVAVRVHTAEARKHVAIEETVGTVRPWLQARLEAKVAGRIELVRAIPGQLVKTGELLVRLEVEDFRARLDRALAVQQQAESELKRFTPLLKSAAITPAEFDAVQSRARVAEAAVQEARTLLGQGQILAPFDGVVTRKLVDVGDVAAPGRTLIEMEDPNTLRFETAVGEALLGGLLPGQTLAVTVPTLASPLTGTVVEIAPTVDPASRTFLVKLDLPKTLGLRGGTFGRVAIPVGESPVLRVPSTAVIQRGQLEYIFVVVDGHAQMRLVRTGRTLGAEIELLSGAVAGESVVASSEAPLRDGQPVQIRP